MNHRLPFLLHKKIQEKILNSLPTGQAMLEKKIGHHVADIIWLNQRIVFEVQCSPISFDQARKRTFDYKEMGFNVTWILHSKTFNKRFVSAQEAFFRRMGAYYTNIIQSGEGVIYDQLELFSGNYRTWKSHPLPVDLTKPLHKGNTLSYNGDKQHLKCKPRIPKEKREESLWLAKLARKFS